MVATRGPAETQGPHESGLVLPDSLGLVTAIGASHQQVSVVRGSTHLQRCRWQGGERGGEQWQEGLTFSGAQTAREQRHSTR